MKHRRLINTSFVITLQHASPKGSVPPKRAGLVSTIPSDAIDYDGGERFRSNLLKGDFITPDRLHF